MVLFLSVNVQNQLVMKIIKEKLEGELLKGCLVSKGKQSLLLSHALNNNPKTVNYEDFKIIDNLSYCNNRFKKKISEVLCIKQHKPSLNTQKQSVPLKLLTKLLSKYTLPSNMINRNFLWF